MTVPPNELVRIPARRWRGIILDRVLFVAELPVASFSMFFTNNLKILVPGVRVGERVKITVKEVVLPLTFEEEKTGERAGETLKFEFKVPDGNWVIYKNDVVWFVTTFHLFRKSDTVTLVIPARPPPEIR